METLLQFIGMAFLIGILIGVVINTQILKLMISRGSLPPFMIKRKGKIQEILKKYKGGDFPQAVE